MALKRCAVGQQEVDDTALVDAAPLVLPYMMLLRERGGERMLPAWVGRAEATELALSLETAGLLHRSASRTSR